MITRSKLFGGLAVISTATVLSAPVAAAPVHVETFEDNITTLADWVARTSGATPMYVAAEPAFIAPNGREFGFVTNPAISSEADEFANIIRSRSPMAPGVNSLAGDAATFVTADADTIKWGRGEAAGPLVVDTIATLQTSGSSTDGGPAPAPVALAASGGAAGGAASNPANSMQLSSFTPPSGSLSGRSALSTTGSTSIMDALTALELQAAVTGGSNTGGGTSNDPTTRVGASPVPLPAGAGLLAGALAMFGFMRRKSA